LGVFDAPIIAGIVGSAVARRLIDSGYRVTGLCRHTVQDRSRLAGLSGCECLEYDDEDPSSLPRVLHGRSFAACFNLAAYGVLGSQKDAERLRRTNELLGPELIRNLPPSCLYVHAGSVFEYGTGQPGVLIREDDVTAPFSLYGETKLNGSRGVLKSAADRGSIAVVLRLFHIYGPGEAQARLLPYLIEKLEKGEAADLTSGEQVRDFLFVEDAVEAFVRTLKFLNQPPVDRVFNVCSSQPVTIRCVGEQLATQLDRPQSLLRWGVRPPRAEEPAWLVGDASRFAHVTGWKPAFSLIDGLIRTIQHCQNSTDRVSAPHFAQTMGAASLGLTTRAEK